MRPDYLLLGHLTHDVLPDGATAPGGTSLYSGVTAYQLGRRVAIASAPVELPAGWPVDIAFAAQASLPPVFENRYGTIGRQQVLHAAAAPIELGAVPADWHLSPVVHLAPVLDELPEQLIMSFPQALLGVTPQGWMRHWGDVPGPITYRPWRPAPSLLQRVDLLVLSIEDIAGDEALALEYAQACPLVALTRGAQGATLFVRGTPHTIAAFPATESDPTGAGDVFAAALLVRLHETSDPIAAAYFAACAAALSVEGSGTSRIPTRSEIERRISLQ